MEAGERGHTKSETKGKRRWNIGELDGGVKTRQNVKGQRETERGKRTLQSVFWGRNMSDIPLGVKLSCNSLFSSYSNTVMHTDNYNTTACLPAACFNQIYLKLREREQGREAEMKKGRDGPREKSKANSSEIISTFFPCLIFCKMLNNYTGILCYLSAVTVCNALIWGFAFHLHISA